ncbi:MAG: TetR/AcrR family transcriptional regulator [Alphaproteobacteria bacterium]|nr:TetR/AcrR family transcriptional regulator [Alphaproteobacteria bacterium]
MQVKNERRSNEERTRQTRAALIVAARSLFLEKGFAETSTPEIVKAAQVTRGALYHHFDDKIDLFRSVILSEAETVADEIEARTSTEMAPLEAMIQGAEAYFDAMSAPGRAQLMLIDGPAILGHAEISAIDQQTGGEELRQGLAHVFGPDANTAQISATADLLSAMFDRAALAIAMGAKAGPYKAALTTLLNGLANG